MAQSNSKGTPLESKGAPGASVRRGPWPDAPVPKNPSYVYADMDSSKVFSIILCIMQNNYT